MWLLISWKIMPQFPAMSTLASRLCATGFLASVAVLSQPHSIIVKYQMLYILTATERSGRSILLCIFRWNKGSLVVQEREVLCQVQVIQMSWMAYPIANTYAHLIMQYLKYQQCFITYITKKTSQSFRSRLLYCF